MTNEVTAPDAQGAHTAEQAWEAWREHNSATGIRPAWLAGYTAALVDQQAALGEAVRVIEGFIRATENAYDIGPPFDEGLRFLAAQREGQVG